MKRPLISFFENIKDSYREYFKLLKQGGLITFYRLILAIPTLIFIFVIQIPLLVLQGVRSSILSALMVNRNLIKLSNPESKDPQPKLHLFDLRFENYLYGFFETFPLIALFGLSMAIFIIQGASNLVFLFFTWSPNLLFSKFLE